MMKLYAYIAYLLVLCLLSERADSYRSLSRYLTTSCSTTSASTIMPYHHTAIGISPRSSFPSTLLQSKMQHSLGSVVDKLSINSKKKIHPVKALAATAAMILALINPMDMLVHADEPTQSQSQSQSQQNFEVKKIQGFQTKDGLIYFDLVEPDPKLPTPQYGEFVSFYYSLYYQESPDKELLLMDSNFGSAEPFLNKHGNNRVIRGIDDALHSMTVGSKRRVIIPYNLGYNEYALGPVPIESGNRRKTSQYLTLIEQNKGKLVADLELAFIGEDENDQGYYSDIPIPLDDIRALAAEQQQYMQERKLQRQQELEQQKREQSSPSSTTS
jgi:hypothetical protein